MSDRESQLILSLLFDHMKAPEHQVRFRWQPDAVAMWNERTTQHYGVGRYSGRRIMHRVIALGGPPS